METGKDNRPHKLEDLKRRLFSKNYRNKMEYKDGFSPVSHRKVADSWENSETVSRLTDKILKKTSLFKKFFVISIAFFILSVGYAAYVFFAGSNTVSNDNIEISITGNNFVAGGEELDLVIGIANRNAASPSSICSKAMSFNRQAPTKVAITAPTRSCWALKKAG